MAGPPPPRPPELRRAAACICPDRREVTVIRPLWPLVRLIFWRRNMAFIRDGFYVRFWL